MSTTPTPPVARDYARAVQDFTQLQAQDGAEINPVCRSQLLTHGETTDRAIILIHGMTNCPQQFCDFAPRLFEQGYNVLIPRMPRNGLADRNTKALAALSVAEQIAFGNQICDIAYGLGRHVTVAGISAGGVITGWVAQFRPDVDVAVLIAPSFGIVPRLPIANDSANWLAMQLLLTLPNIMTQRIRPFTEGPPQGYFGFATRGLARAMKLGAEVFQAAKNQPPAARSILFILNRNDPAVNNDVALQLARRWREHGAAITNYAFPAERKLIHDVIDPQQPQQQTAYTYPILLDLLTKA